MRLLPVLLLALLSALSAAETPAKAWPLWDGVESVEAYAKKVNLPPTQTLDLGNNVKLELVLIPAGQFVMGTPAPAPIDEAKFRGRIELGIVLLALSACVLLVLAGSVAVRAIRKRQRPKFSLARLLAMTILAGIAVLSALHWRQNVRALADARIEFQAAKAHFDAARPGEKPAHSVTLTRPFYMGKFPMTQEQYQQVRGENPSEFVGKDNPVEHLAFYDADEFCMGLRLVLGNELRLPTEAEWEFACRAGSATDYSSGPSEADLDRVGWYSANSGNKTHPVGQKAPNKFGLYDMHGNVLEWCQDHVDYYRAGAAVDPQCLATFDGRGFGGRALRGGVWWMPSKECRSASRHLDHLDSKGHSGSGLRVVLPAQ